MQPADAIGFASFIAQTDAVGRVILVLLLLMSVLTWYLLATRAAAAYAARGRSRRFLEAFRGARALAHIEARLGEAGADDPFSNLARHSIAAARHPRTQQALAPDAADSGVEFLARAMRRVIDEESARLESGLTLLGSVGATAPFVGLFGTVWGVYHALVAIGLSGQGTLDKVAGPVGEALIMTAIGLAVAVPAVLGYNAIVRSNRTVLARLEAFAHDLHAILTTGAAIGEPPRTAAPAVPANPRPAPAGGR